MASLLRLKHNFPIPCLNLRFNVIFQYRRERKSSCSELLPYIEKLKIIPSRYAVCGACFILLFSQNFDFDSRVDEVLYTHYLSDVPVLVRRIHVPKNRELRSLYFSWL